MPPRFLCAPALFLLMLVLTLTLPVSRVWAQGTRLSEPAGGFSYLPPVGWRIKTVPGMKYKVCDTVSAGGFAPNLMASDDTDPLPLVTYVHASLAKMQQAHADLHVLSLAPFVTSSGIRGMRLAVVVTRTNRRLYQVFYVFPTPGSRKILTVAAWLASDGNKYAAAVDSAMKTFKLQ